MNCARLTLSLLAAGPLAARSSAPAPTGGRRRRRPLQRIRLRCRWQRRHHRQCRRQDPRRGLPRLKDPKNILSKRSVLFDYDSYVIKDQYRPLVEAHAKFLVSHPVKMLIQGNTDERGSREYNLALGQKRADAVKKALGLLGVSEGQLESVSLGEEKPSCSDASESCWAANRRGDMLYSGEF